MISLTHLECIQLLNKYLLRDFKENIDPIPVFEDL